MNDKVFKYVLATIFFVISCILYGFANSVSLTKQIYTLQKPMQLTGDGIHPTVFSVPIKIKEHTNYLLKAKVSGYPVAHFDFYGPGYDSPKQEVATPTGEKKDFIINTVFNSESPPGSVALRIYYLSKEPIEVSELSLQEELFNYGYYMRIAATILLISFLVILLLASYTGQLFYFILVFAIAFIGYSPAKLPSTAQGSDNRWYMPQVLSLIVEQNIDMNEYPNRMKENNRRIITIGNAKLNFFPYGTVLVNYPLTLITKHFFKCNLVTEAEKLSCGLQVAELNAKILASMSVGFMFLIVLTLTNSLSTSALLAFIFAFASPHFSLHAGGLWSHNISIFLITITLFLMLQKFAYTYLASIPLFLSYMARPSMSISVALLSVYYCIVNRANINAVMKYATLLALMGCMFLIINLFIYGGILPPYYAGNRLSLTTFREAILGIFISPNRGLFVFFPVALFSFFGIYLTIRELVNEPKILNSDKVIFIVLSLLVVLQSFVYASFPDWWMGHSYGPRMFAESIPYLIILLIPALEYIKNIKIIKVLLVLCIAFSLYVQLAGAFSSKVLLWNANPTSVGMNKDTSRLWDWYDMQMFRWLR